MLVNPVTQEFVSAEVSDNLKSLLMGIVLVVMGTIPSVSPGARNSASETLNMAKAMEASHQETAQMRH